MPSIKVYPTHEAALDVTHPVSGALSDDGSLWEHDAFTARMISDNAITTDVERRHRSARPKRDLGKPPAHATSQSASLQVAEAPADAGEPDDHEN